MMTAFVATASILTGIIFALVAVRLFPPADHREPEDPPYPQW